jgi:hypothetical protein
VNTEQAIERLMAMRDNDSSYLEWGGGESEIEEIARTEIDAFDLAISALRAQQEQENPKPLTLVFGDGKIAVSTCYGEQGSDLNELLLWNPNMQQKVGEFVPVKEGTTTDDVDVYARLFFKNAESAQVVVDALNEIIANYSEPKEAR